MKKNNKKNNTKVKILIIGYGNFGRLMADLMPPFLEIFVYDKNPIINIKDGISIIDKSQIKEMDYIIFSVPVQFLADAVAEFRDLISPSSYILDVSSVKVFPLQILSDSFPNNQVIGTHPLFGPESIAKKLDNLKVVISNISGDREAIEKIKVFIEEKLYFDVIEMTAEQHDKQMAHIQALSHFIGFGLRGFNLKEDLELKTLAYRKMYALYENISHDTQELFETIQEYNPYAKEIRKEFIQHLIELDKKCLD